MRYIKINQVINSLGTPVSSKSRLYFFQKIDSNYLFSVIDNIQGEIIESYNFERDYSFSIFENSVYFNCDNSIKRFNLNSGVIESIIESNYDYLTVINENRIIASKYNSEIKNYINSLIDFDGKEIPEFNKYESFFGFLENYVFCTNYKSSELGVYNLSNNIYIWKIEFTNSITTKPIFLDNLILIVDSYILRAYNVNNGQMLWELEKTLDYYNYDDKLNMLYGLGGNTFEIINVATGQREMQKELDLQIPAHLTYFADGYLYFSGYKGDNVTRIFGAVDVNTGEIAFTQSIETPNGEVYRGSYNRPLVVGNRLYIRDQQKTLHIYERQNL